MDRCELSLSQSNIVSSPDAKSAGRVRKLWSGDETKSNMDRGELSLSLSDTGMYTFNFHCFSAFPK